VIGVTNSTVIGTLEIR